MKIPDSINDGVAGNAAYDILKIVLMITITSILSFFGYKVVKKRKEDTEEERKPQETKEPSTPLLTPYPKPNENEVKGRDYDLQEIEVLLENNKDVLLLSGMGGIGKTTLAAYYVQQNEGAYNRIAWVNTSQGFYEAFAYNAQLNKCLALEDRLTALKDTTDPKDYPQQAYNEIINGLNKLSGKLLLVIDNAIEGQPLQTLRDELKKEWKLLVTAREPLGGFTTYAVGVLNEAAATELFYLHYTREANDDLVKDIIQRVANHTLSIELIAKTAQAKTGYTLLQLKTDLESKGLTLAKGIEVKTKYNQQGGHYEYKTHIMGCLQAAFDVAQLGENVAYLYALKNLCLLPAIAMGFDFIKGLLQIEEEEETNTFNNTLNSLVAKGWLEQDEENYKMHPVLQETLQTQLHPQPEDVDTLVSSLTQLLKTDENTHGIEKVPFIPYAESVLAYFINENIFAFENYTEAWENIAALANNLSMIYQGKGELDNALTYQLKALEIKEKALGENHPSLATSYNNISTIYQAKGELGNALRYQLKAIEIIEKVLGENHPDLATSYNNLSLIYKNKGELDNALTYQLKAIEIREKVLDENHPDLAQSYNNLSTIYLDKGELDNALRYQLKDIEICKKVLGENHPDLATSYNNLSTIYKAKGELDNALRYQLKDIEIIEKVLGEHHPYLATSYNNLSVIYKNKGELDNALTYQLKAIEIKENVLGENHPDLAQSYNNLSTIYYDKGELDNALTYQLKAIEIWEKVLGENHPDLAISYNNISLIYQDKGELDNALRYQLKTIEIFEKVLGENHPDLATAYNNLSLIYKNKGELDNALTYQLKDIEISKKILGENHPHLGISYGNLADIYEAMGQTEKAAAYEQKYEAIKEFNKQRGWA